MFAEKIYIHLKTRQQCADFPTGIVDRAPRTAPEQMPHFFVFCPGDLDL